MTKRPNPPGGGYWYGVSTSLCDGAGVEYLAGIAAYDNLPKTDPGRFRFSVFRVGAGGVLAYLPLEDEASGLGGAGTIYVRSSDGTGRYSCASAKAAYDGAIPGFVPLAPRVPVAIPPDGAIAALYQGVYSASDFDTPAEAALRVGKQLAAINQLVELLIAAGVVRR